MTPTRSLPCIEAVLEPAGAARIASRIAGTPDPPAMRRLQYPYYRFTFRSSTGTVLGRLVSQVRLVVDARAGVAATADPFDVVTRPVPTTEVLEPRLAESEAFAIARRQVAHVVRARGRALACAQIESIDQDLVYKPYFVVTDGPTPLLLDGVTGAVYPLAP